VVVVVEIGYECLGFLFALTACGRGAGVGISSLETVGLGWMDSVTGCCRSWERELGRMDLGRMKEEKQARLEWKETS
jgi:hypothetical protein